MTSPQTKAKTVHILYGMNEGPGHARALAAELHKRGFTLVPDIEKADVIIAHSGGIFLLPETTTHKTVIMMNPSCAPSPVYIAVFLRKMAAEFLYHVWQRTVAAWLRKGLYNAWYALARAPHNLRQIARGASCPDKLPSLTNTKVWVVTARHDPWAKHLALSELERLPEYTYLSQDVSHDSIWIAPKDCADIVQSAYGT